MRVLIPEHDELEAARKSLLLEVWADSDEFFGGSVEEVFAVEGHCVLAPGLAEWAQVVGAQDCFFVEDFSSSVDDVGGACGDCEVALVVQELQGCPRRPGTSSRPCRSIGFGNHDTAEGTGTEMEGRHCLGERVEFAFEICAGRIGRDSRMRKQPKRRKSGSMS